VSDTPTAQATSAAPAAAPARAPTRAPNAAANAASRTSTKPAPSSVATDSDDDLLEFLGSLDDDGDDENAAKDWLEFLARTDLDAAASRRSRDRNARNKPESRP
jgi:hypothetical protein